MDIKEFREILHLNPTALDTEEIIKICGYWEYDENQPGEPHAILSSGNAETEEEFHTNIFYKIIQVLQFSNLRKELSKRLLKKIKKELSIRYIDFVASSSYSAIPIGQEIAEGLNAAFVFTEKIAGDQVFTDRFNLSEGALGLQVEELITTSKTVRAVKRAILTKDPKISFFESKEKTVVATLIYRPHPETQPPKDYSIVSLKEETVPRWLEGECPLCQKGSPAIKPKEHWERFKK